MKVLVIKGSPHLNETSSTLVNQFIKGTKEKGHQVEEIYLIKTSLHPCLGCDRCALTNSCIQNDDGNEILNKILNCDCLVLTTPVYYFGVSAQLKTLIDRFYSKNSEINHRHLKVIYMAAAYDSSDKVMEAISAHFDILTSYLNMEEVGRILAKGAASPANLKKEYLLEAYELGKNL